MVRDVIKKKMKSLSTITLVLVLPLVLKLLATTFDSIGLAPYLVYQLYYLPLGAWLGRPFFNHDSELGIVVLPLGAITTAIFYVLVVVGLRRLFAWIGRRFQGPHTT